MTMLSIQVKTILLLQLPLLVLTSLVKLKDVTEIYTLLSLFCSVEGYSLVSPDVSSLRLAL